MNTTNIDTFKTIREVENYRRAMNEACDKRINYISLCETANAASEKPFGYIKEAFETISPILFKSTEGKRIMNKYTDTIKESWNLSSLHHLYETIRKAGKNSDMDFLMDSIANEDWRIDSRTVAEDTKKLGRVLAEGIICAGLEGKSLLPEEKKSLDLSIMYIAENRKSHKNLAEYSNAMKVIRESVMDNENGVNIFEDRDVDLDKTVHDLCEDFNRKYNADNLSEPEIKVLKSLLNSEDREKIFNEYKGKCIDEINEAKKSFESKGDKMSSDRLATVMEQVNGKVYNPDTVGDDVYSLIQLSNILSE